MAHIARHSLVSEHKLYASETLLVTMATRPMSTVWVMLAHSQDSGCIYCAFTVCLLGAGKMVELAPAPALQPWGPGSDPQHLCKKPIMALHVTHMWQNSFIVAALSLSSLSPLFLSLSLSQNQFSVIQSPTSTN